MSDSGISVRNHYVVWLLAQLFRRLGRPGVVGVLFFSCRWLPWARNSQVEHNIHIRELTQPGGKGMTRRLQPITAGEHESVPGPVVDGAPAPRAAPSEESLRVIWD